MYKNNLIFRAFFVVSSYALVLISQFCLRFNASMQEKETQQVEQRRESEVDVALHTLFKKYLHDEIMKLNTTIYDDKNH